MNKLPEIIKTPLLITFEGKKFELESVAENRFLSPVISKIPKQTFKQFVYMLITQTFIKCGQKIEADQATCFNDLFLEELKDLPWLTIVELSKAFKKGYKGHYGKYYGLNVKTFISWVESYILVDRMLDLNKCKLLKELPQTIVTAADEIAIMKTGVIRCFNELSEVGFIAPGNIHIYSFLKDHKLIRTDRQFIKDIKSIAWLEIQKMYSLENARGPKQLIYYNTVSRELHKNSKKFTNKCKEIALLVYFNNLIVEEIDIEKLLTNYIMKQKKAAIVCDTYKVIKFEEKLKEKGFEYEIEPGITPDTTTINVSIMPKDVQTIKVICHEVELFHKQAN